jgi:hypothetical protein
MSKEEKEPPRGEAAWMADKRRIAAKNEAAYARGREERAASNARDANRRRAAERRDYASLPKQPSASYTERSPVPPE